MASMWVGARGGWLHRAGLLVLTVCCVAVALSPAGAADPNQRAVDPPPGVDAATDLAVPTADVAVPGGTDSTAGPGLVRAAGPVGGQDLEHRHFCARSPVVAVRSGQAQRQPRLHQH